MQNGLTAKQVKHTKIYQVGTFRRNVHLNETDGSASRPYLSACEDQPSLCFGTFLRETNLCFIRV